MPTDSQLDHLWVVAEAVPKSILVGLDRELTQRRRAARIEPAAPQDEPYVRLRGLFSEQDPSFLAMSQCGETTLLGTVILTDSRRLDTYRKAFTYGVSVVHVDSGPTILADVIIARSRGELLASADLVASCFGAYRATLSPGESLIVPLLAEDRTTAQIADQLHFSERHVRRLIHSILVKAETNDRREAAAIFSVA